MLSRLYKLIFDLGVCCSLGAFLLYYFTKRPLQAGILLFLVGAAVFALFLKEKRHPFMLPMIILPALGWFLLRPAVVELIVYLPVWGYMIYLLHSDRLVVSRGEFLDRVRSILALCLILPIFMLAELHTFAKSIEVALPYLVVTMLSIVFLLRHLRTLKQIDGHKGGYSGQIWEVLIFLMACVLLTMARAPQNLLLGLRLLYHNLLQPILSFLAGLIGVILGGIIYGIISLLSFVTESRELSLRQNELGNRLKDSLDISTVAISNKTWILPLLYSLGVILALMILFFFLRWLIGEKGKQRLPEGVSEIREVLEDTTDTKLKHRWKYSMEPTERIRYYYMKYLIHLNSHKIPILPGDTTRDVDQKYTDRIDALDYEQRQASKRMKWLYREARYQKQREMTGEEGEQAKKLYQLIKSKKRINE